VSLVRFFDRLLRGTPPQDTAELDQLVVKQLLGVGADLAQPRHVRHFLCFEEEADARRAAQEIERADYVVTVTAPHAEVAQWTVLAEGFRVIGSETAPGFRAWFEEVGSEFHGEYDGWEPATKP